MRFSLDLKNGAAFEIDGCYEEIEILIQSNGESKAAALTLKEAEAIGKALQFAAQVAYVVQEAKQ